jgi:hypothetical protein
MTREEAIKALKWFKEYNGGDYDGGDYDGGDRIIDKYGDCYYRVTERDFEAFDMAIKALEQEPNTNNDLVVDCISRADALDCVNWGYSFSDIYKKINELPPVTPIRPKGHWINIDETHSKCDRCGGVFEIASANGETNFCPNCGADMREVEE